MSVLPKTRLPMRIIALPLTSSVRGPRHTEEPSSLVYYHFQMPPKAKNRRSGWVDWATVKAASIWAQFGKYPENSWRFKIFSYGERLVDRVDFEELALKGVDPSMGPKISHPRSPSEEQKKSAYIPLVHPGMGTSPLAHLEAILTRRTPRHRKGFYTWMLLAPLTTPFMLIPVIPNFPFFFCVWRSWSHYRGAAHSSPGVFSCPSYSMDILLSAYKASDYLRSLLQRGAIIPHLDANLDGIYARHAPSDADTNHDLTNTVSEGGKDKGKRTDEKKVLLGHDAVPHILELYGLPESAASNIYRAVEQAGARLRKGIYT